MALTEIYVDPSIAADSGTGTIGDPYGDLRYAIEQETFDLTNGTRINVKAGTAEVLNESLTTSLADTTVSVAWVPSATAPLVIQGYTTAAGDGGIGIIDGAATYSIFSGGTVDNLVLVDLELRNTGTNAVLDLDNSCVVYRCNIHTSTGVAVQCDNNNAVIGCYLHNCLSGGVCVTANLYAYNYISDMSLNGLSLSGAGACVYRNVVSVTGSVDGISIAGNSFVWNNSVYSAGGSGSGIVYSADTGTLCINNVVEGFSDTGGIGIEANDAGAPTVMMLTNNSVYDCATEYSLDAIVTDLLDVFGGNETLTASPFTSPSTGDFSTVDTGGIKEGSIPSIIGGGLV